jgi:glycosyltransferase involved in cell wall biosynthesis
MKLLMTADTVGGVWTYAAELARGLEPHGIEILLVTAGGPLSESQRAEIDALPHVRLVETRYKLEWMPDPWEHVSALGRRLRDLADGFRPDVIHLNDFSHGDLDWDAPVLVVGHSCVCSWFESVRGHAAGPEWDRYRGSVADGLRAADLVAAPTKFMLAALEKHYGPFETTRVLPNGYTTPILDDNGERGATGGSSASAERPSTSPTDDKEPFLFAAGRWWDDAKNIAALGRIAPRLPWPVKVAGLPAPDGAAMNLPGNVENLGRLGPAEMRACYAHAAIYCLPARYEPFGLTPLEAANHGCALVLGDIPSLREVWGDAAAFVPPDDADALAATLNRLIADEPVRAELASRARERAANFTRERMAAGYLEAYRNLTNQPRLGPTLRVGPHGRDAPRRVLPLRESVSPQSGGFVRSHAPRGAEVRDSEKAG